jgi:cytochrome c biogenesis protein CcmG/thiol:disulfide interchange protein DsbE
MIAVWHYAESVRRSAVPFVVITAVALIGLLVYGVLSVGASTTLDDAVKRGDNPVAPDRSLPLLDGGQASIASFKGKPVVLNFWASWCDPCKDEAPEIEAAHRRLRRAGGTVLGVTVSDETSDSKAFMRKYGMTFPSVRDVDGELAEDFGTTGVPETFVIDRAGRISAISRGQIKKGFLDAAVARVLR